LWDPRSSPSRPATTPTAPPALPRPMFGLACNMLGVNHACSAPIAPWIGWGAERGSPNYVLRRGRASVGDRVFNAIRAAASRSVWRARLLSGALESPVERATFRRRLDRRPNRSDTRMTPCYTTSCDLSPGVETDVRLRRSRRHASRSTCRNARAARSECSSIRILGRA
jgi:hypothetical protein